MAIAVVSLMVILVSVEGGQKPFTAFHKQQVELVHGSSRTFQPVFQRSFSFPPASTTLIRFQPSSRYSFANFGLQGTGGRNFVRGRFTSGNIVENAKAQAEESLRILKAYENSSIVAEYIEPILSTSDCLNNLEDVTKLTQEAIDLIVENGPELIYVDALVQTLKEESDIVKLIKSTAKILRALDGVANAVAAGSSNLCNPSLESSVKEVKAFALVVGAVSDNKQINMPQSSREQLKFIAKIMDQVANLLETQIKALEAFGKQCENGNKSRDIYESTSKILESVAKIYEDLGSEDGSVDIKKKSDFIKKFENAASELDRLDIDIDCSLKGDLSSLALLLEDLAAIIESVGLEKLSEELGINFDINSV